MTSAMEPPIGEQVGLTENEPESPRSSVGGCMASPCRGCSGWLLVLDWVVRISVPHPAGKNADACAFPSRRRPAQTHVLVCVRGAAAGQPCSGTDAARPARGRPPGLQRLPG